VITSTRSWTDLITNVTLLGDAQVDDVPQLLGWFEGPDKLLPAFLHEATHHWCFNSPVGYALSMLHLRMERHAVLYVQADGTDARLADSVLEDANRYETAVAFLRPLAEGLALFAEFDGVTRSKSAVFSTPLEFASSFFASPNVASAALEHRREDFVPAMTHGFIVRVRLSDAMLRRKVSVLGQPLNCAGEAYLPGYLIVRSLWQDIARRIPLLLNETDLFLMYLRSFFFDDLGLVAALLDTSRDEIAGASAVGERVHTRFAEFLNVTPTDVEAYEAAVLATGDGDWLRNCSRALRVNESEHLRGELRAQELIAWYERPASSDIERFFQTSDQEVLTRRELLYVGSWPIEVVVDRCRFRAIDGSKTVLEGAARPVVAEGAARGYIDVLHWGARHARVCAVFKEGELVATQSMTPTLVENDETLVGLLYQRDEASHRLREFDKVVDFVVREGWRETALDHVRSEAAGATHQLYVPLALAAATDEQLPVAEKALRDRGFYPLLNFDRRLIEGFAELGLCCSWFPARSGVEAVFDRMGLSLDQTVAACDELQRTVGVGRLRQTQQGELLPSV
jgi:hypothetical protein